MFIIIIRAAQLKDKDAVCILWQKLISFYGKEAPIKTVEKTFTTSLANKDQFILLAEIDGKVIGTAALYAGHYSTWSDTWYGHIEDVYVDENYRRRGVAENLVRELLKLAKTHGLSRVELHTLKDNVAAHKLYEKIGFTSSSILYEYGLSQ
ncbi:MAG: GNAT family N-acetyltransferase [Bacillota bacterium]